jgi:RNA polymerase primary sigma factor
MSATSLRTSDGQRRRTSDPVSWYLATIGREPLLTAAEEIELGNQVQAMMQLVEQSRDDYSTQERKIMRVGQRAKQRMMKANLRLVVSVAKKYQGKGLELLDLIQEGSLGLERAVEKFDPTRGYKFSTYAFWWIRQSMTRAIACQSRTIRLPVHLSERLTAIRKVSLDLAHKLGAMPSRQEIAEAMGMPLDELDGLLRQALTTSSLDAPVNGDEGRSFLGDLIADGNDEEPLDRVERGIHQEQLGRWLSHLSEQERQVLHLRFGLEGQERHTLAEIGRQLDVSRERVRQVELKALRKLRNLTRRTGNQA